MLRILGWALLGAVIGGAVAFGAGLFWLSYINTDNREGAAAMGVAFVITPFGASGEHMSPPHRLATDKIIRNQDLCFIDIGAMWNGYFADIGRTTAASLGPSDWPSGR